MAIPSKNVLGNPNVTEGNFQIAIEQLRESVIGSGKPYDNANTYMQYDTCIHNGITYYSKINSNTGNTPSVGVNWGLIGDLFNLLITNGTALGYGAGSGGTVTQLTSKSTSVTLNKPTGQIVMNNAALAAGAVVTFILQNSLIYLTDTLCLNQKWGNENYMVQVQDIIAGGARIQIENRSSVSQSESITLSFTVIKGATA